MQLPKIPDNVVKGICKVGGILGGAACIVGTLLGGRNDQIALEEAVREEVARQTGNEETEEED